MIWVLFGIMMLAAALTIAWPLYRRQKRLTPVLAASVVTVLGLSALVYSRIGTPVAPQPNANVAGMIASLEGRLRKQPDDLDGWKMLGVSYMHLQQYPQAIDAYEHAVQLESASNAQTLADLGEAVFSNDRSSITGHAGQLFENAMAIDPNNGKALFYGGIAAFARGDKDKAADRWETLLAMSPPPEIQAILRQRIAAWRGTSPAAGEAAGQGVAAAAGPAVVTVDVSLGPQASAVVAPDTTVFIIARDPAQPSPPIAAVRRKASELPLKVPLGDADAMIPGRLLSAFKQVEIVVRASLSGQPIAQTGDWYGQQTVAPSETPSVNIVIEQKVP